MSPEHSELILYRLERARETLKEAVLNRQKGDYTDLLKFSKEEAERWTTLAESFVTQLSPLVQMHLEGKR